MYIYIFIYLYSFYIFKNVFVKMYKYKYLYINKHIYRINIHACMKNIYLYKYISNTHYGNTIGDVLNLVQGFKVRVRVRVNLIHPWSWSIYTHGLGAYLLTHSDTAHRYWHG